jgi:hypothetical protein
MKNLLKAYEKLSIVFMFGFLILMLIALVDGANSMVRGSMDSAVAMMVLSFIFILTTSWTHSSTYLAYKTRNGYDD